jgi:hypothetical protein
MKSLRRRLLDRLGPGLITGAADDDPSGIATYSQAGAQFGFGMLWSVLLTTPLMVGIQIVSGAHRTRHRTRDCAQPAAALSALAALRDRWTITSRQHDQHRRRRRRHGRGAATDHRRTEHGHAVIFGVVVVLLQSFFLISDWRRCSNGLRSPCSRTSPCCLLSGCRGRTSYSRRCSRRSSCPSAT